MIHCASSLNLNSSAHILSSGEEAASPACPKRITTTHGEEEEGGASHLHRKMPMLMIRKTQRHTPARPTAEIRAIKDPMINDWLDWEANEDT